jgi:hypothetical protein
MRSGLPIAGIFCRTFVVFSNGCTRCARCGACRTWNCGVMTMRLSLVLCVPRIPDPTTAGCFRRHFQPVHLDPLH